MQNDEEDKGIEFIFDTVGYSHIKDIIIEYIKYPPNVQLVDILNYAL